MFIPLHAHLAKGSVGDSVMNTADYVEKAAALGMTHLAMTDHGSMSAMIDFYDACIEKNITPIIGLEAYVTPDRTVKDKAKGANYGHLVLLAKNKEGVENLIAIHNDAEFVGKYYKQRTDISVLRKYGKNIIALSACVVGEIPKLILKNDIHGATAPTKTYEGIFDSFYLEIQPATFQEQIIVNDWLVYLAYITNTPLVATNDIHYLNAEDWAMHDLHIKSCQKGRESFSDHVYYLMGEEELKSKFVYTHNITPEVVQCAINNTVYIASQCNGEVDWHFEMPEYKGLPEGETDSSYLAKLCYQALNERSYTLSDPATYADRLNYELTTINKLGFCGYFLIVWDLIRHAKEANIAMGPGRGSCGSSLVSWLLGITLADPIKYGFMFERFLSPNRKGLPDIDLDISSDRRKEMFQYAINKYGADCCSQVMTYTMRKAKGAIRDAARMLNIPIPVVNNIVNLIPFVSYDEDGEKKTDLSIKESLVAEPKLIAYQRQYPQLFYVAMKLEGLPISSKGVHAAGLLISPTPLVKKLPMKMHDGKNEGITMPTACFTKENVERVAVKFDFLGLATISVISQTQRDVNIQIDLSNEDFYKDAAVWKTIGSKMTDGMFQISSQTYKKRMPRLRPTTIQELAACLALIRGPCISAKTDEEYMQIIEGTRQIRHISPQYDAVTANTKGIAIYQEEVMQLAMVHGFSVDEGYALLKAASKKKIDKLKGMEATFRQKATAQGISIEVQNMVFQTILDAGLYSFNMSHAVCYALIAYVSAWLKYHYPIEFMANLLSNAYINKKYQIIEDVLKDCRAKGICFLPLDINRSSERFKAENGKIRIGFCAIKGLGDSAAAEIVAHQPYSSIADFDQNTDNKKVNQKIILLTIYAGCFNTIGSPMQNYYSFCNTRGITPSDKVKIGTEEYRVDITSDELESELLRAPYMNFAAAELLPTNFTTINNNDEFLADVYISRSVRKKNSKGQMMAILDLEGSDASFRGIIPNSVYLKVPLKKALNKGNFLKIKGRKDKDDSCIILAVA